jgi:hypothetical protein
MKWRYGIVKYRHKQDKNVRFYSIGELYYESNPLEIFACSEQPIDIFTDYEVEDSEEQIKENIMLQTTRIQQDIAKYPIFDIDGPYFSKRPENDIIDEDYAGHIDEYGLEQYYKSLEEEEEE